MSTMRIQLEKERAFRRSVMRRIYYAYALSLVWRPALVLGFAFGASGVALWRLVSLSSIAHNFLAVPVGQVPAFVETALRGAEVAVLVAFGVLVGVGGVIALRVLARVAMVRVQTPLLG